MEVVKTFVTVAAAAGVGFWVGNKVFAAIESKVPASAAKAKPEIQVGLQVGTTVLAFGILRSLF